MAGNNVCSPENVGKWLVYRQGQPECKYIGVIKNAVPGRYIELEPGRHYIDASALRFCVAEERHSE